MRIGLFLAYWPWFSPEEQVALARQADEAGLDSVWVAEAWGQDAVSVLGHLSAVTERVALGSGLMQIPGRTPAMTAMTAATLDVLSGMGAKGKNFYVEAAERFGQGDSAREVQERFMAGDRAGAAMALTPELIDRSAICCRPGEIDERLAYYERAGATTLLAMPFGDRPAIVDRLAAAVAA